MALVRRRSVAVEENPVPGYNLATLFLRDIKTETWNSRLGKCPILRK
jgi:hypothetical protein